MYTDGKFTHISAAVEIPDFVRFQSPRNRVFFPDLVRKLIIVAGCKDYTYSSRL